MAEIIKIKYQKQFKNTAQLNADATLVIPIPESAINTHHFFNDLTIVNRSGSDVEVTPDHDSERSFVVPTKSNYNWDFKNDGIKYTRLKVLELSSANIAIGELQFIVIKKRIEVV